MLPSYDSAQVSGVSSGISSGVPFDLFRFKAVFPDRWAGLLKAHFRSASHVAVFFDCDEKTARNWMAGVTSPNGSSAIIAAASIPGAIQFLMQVAA